ncbi:MAG: rhomboid family intramembrane serine protease [Planctomycetota bacterium]
MKEEARRWGGGSGGGGLRGGRFGRGMDSKSVVTWLLIINIGVFFIDAVMGSARRGAFLAPSSWGNFNVDQAIYGFQVWRFLTYQFLHDGFFHILFNMIGLYFFGPLMEQWWGSKRFLAFYLLCGSSGAVLYALMSIFTPGIIFDGEAVAAARALGATEMDISRITSLVGASGAIFGILAACATLFPHQRVQLLIPPIPMSMRTMALVFLGLSFLSVLAGSANAGGDAAHLGGALLGFVLVKKSGLLNWADRVSPTAISDGINEGRYQKKLERERATEAEVDRILAKVSEKGLASLTKKEKKTLNQASDAKNS